MIQKIKLLFTPYNVLIKLIQLRWRGMLYEEGWFESACLYKSIDKNKNPIPWWSYSFNDFFIPKLNKNLEIFEYGSGNSTIFLSKRVKSIISIEHNKEYYEYVKQQIDNNVNLKYIPLDKYNGEYSKIVLKEQKFFDVIIIDGRDRINCLKNSIQKLKDNGVLILDDSQRKNYQEAKEFMKDNGFKYIDFTGVSAGTYKKKATTIFYKSNNWMGI
jgi:precorrin-6B methylase 2